MKKIIPILLLPLTIVLMDCKKQEDLNREVKIKFNSTSDTVSFKYSYNGINELETFNSYIGEFEVDLILKQGDTLSTDIIENNSGFTTSKYIDVESKNERGVFVNLTPVYYDEDNRSVSSKYIVE